jgi:hypothetical protein
MGAELDDAELILGSFVGVFLTARSQMDGYMT